MIVVVVVVWCRKKRVVDRHTPEASACCRSCSRRGGLTTPSPTPLPRHPPSVSGATSVISGLQLVQASNKP